MLHGTKTVLLQDADGQVIETHSISAGLDYPGVGPDHATLQAMGRAEYVSATDSETVEAMGTLSRLEGIIPALEPSHALAFVMKLAAQRPKVRPPHCLAGTPDTTQSETILVNLCGRGDKDMVTVARYLGKQV